MAANISPDVAAAAARHVHGATIAWGGSHYFDFEQPDATEITLEDYAYALAYTVRWRGQARSGGNRVFYGVAEHCCRGAVQMIEDGLHYEDALAFLTHESDEVVLGDMPGPVKPLLGDFKVLAKRCGDEIDRRFGFRCPDPDVVKRYDVRLLVTERRDLLPGHQDDVWHAAANGGTASAEGYEPFPKTIVPMSHPDKAARWWLRLHNQLSMSLSGVDLG